MLIIEARGFAKELPEVFIHIDPAYDIAFFDDISGDVPGLLYKKYKVIRNIDNLPEHFTNDPNFAPGIGNTVIRKQLCDVVVENGGILKKGISPYARIGHFDTIVSDGGTIMGGASITNNIQLGKSGLVNVNGTLMIAILVSSAILLGGKYNFREYCKGLECIYLEIFPNNIVIGGFTPL